MQSERQPLSWYIDLLRDGVPFSSLLWGDGEFLVAARKRTGATMAHGEVVTRELEDELRAALAVRDADVVHGTDLHIIFPETYMGQDKEAVSNMSDAARNSGVDDSIVWYDGTVFEVACQRGELAPLVKRLQYDWRSVVFIGNEQVAESLPFQRAGNIVIPKKNAIAHLNQIEQVAIKVCYNPIFVVCMGLGAIPLIMRLRKRFPRATYMDLGSTFDVFARLPTRGWMRELAIDPARWESLCRANGGEI